jgi:hypothetical protein
MNDVTEEFILTEGRSLIDLRSIDFGGSALLINGKPVALTMLDMQGSVAEYLLRTGESDVEAEISGVRHFVQGNFQKDVPLSSQLRDFLKLFSPGAYLLSYHDDYVDWSGFFGFDDSWKPEVSSDGFYPCGFVFIATQAQDKYDRNRIDYFKKRILECYNPIALTATLDGEVCYVLDGHHKLKAYEELNVTPTFVCVQPMGPQDLDDETFDAAFGSHGLAKHYRLYTKRSK